MMSAHEALTLNFNAMRLAAAREAIERLGLLTAAAENVIFHLLDGKMIEHPRQLCLKYRKTGEQISLYEKKVLGIRANGFLSVKSHGELTETGKSSPLTAHETTLLRATFTLNRYQTISETRKSGIKLFHDDFKYDVLATNCPSCKKLDGTLVKGAAAAIFPHPDCVCSTANYCLRPHIDWFADID